MTLDMEGQPLLLHFAVWSSSVVLLVSFVLFFLTTIFVLVRTKSLVEKKDEDGLSYSQRAARSNSRLSSYLYLENFKRLRYLHFGSAAGALIAFSIIFLLIGIFGERT